LKSRFLCQCCANAAPRRLSDEMIHMKIVALQCVCVCFFLPAASGAIEITSALTSFRFEESANDKVTNQRLCFIIPVLSNCLPIREEYYLVHSMFPLHVQFGNVAVLSDDDDAFIAGSTITGKVRIPKLNTHS